MSDDKTVFKSKVTFADTCELYHSRNVPCSHALKFLKFIFFKLIADGENP